MEMETINAATAFAGSLATHTDSAILSLADTREHALTPQLVVLGGPEGSHPISLGDRPLTLGSHRDSDVRLPGAARFHATIAPLPDGGHRVLKLTGTGELLLNGRPVQDAHLQPFDRIKAGSHELVYLPAGVDGEEIQSLLVSPDTVTRSVRALGRVELRERLLWLLLVTQSLPPGAEVEPAVEMILEEVIRWTGYDSAALLLRRSEPGLDLYKQLHLDAALDPQELAAFVPLAERILGGEVYAGSSPFSAFAEALCLPVCNGVARAPERRRMTIGRVEGILVLGRAEESRQPLERDVLTLLGALTRQLATLLANVRVFRQATTDPLTGLATRACAVRVIEEELQRARALGNQVAFLLLDVDDFKSVNDTFGHPVGDAVLARLGERLRAELRGDDFACRWGGEEFLVVLPATDEAGARTVADKVMRNLPWSSPELQGRRITASAGLAVFPEHGTASAQVVEAADRALYQAKHDGKDRYRVFVEAPTGVVGTPDGLAEAGDTPLLLSHPLIGAVPLSRRRITLGRHPSADVSLCHPRVSRNHGTVEVEFDGQVFFQDCSRNGTRLNGERIQRARLRAGDVLSVGPYDFQVLSARIARQGDVVES